MIPEDIVENFGQSQHCKTVIQLGTSLRTIAHIFLKLSWRTLSKIV